MKGRSDKVQKLKKWKVRKQSSLEGKQEKSDSKGNKSKKVKHLPSFGRNKKKAVITNKTKDVQVPENETQESKEVDHAQKGEFLRRPWTS